MRIHMEPYWWAYFLFLIPIGVFIAVWWRAKERLIERWATEIVVRRGRKELDRELG
jgi:hypothetical protein